jgi:class 3 adenylate cyclase
MPHDPTKGERYRVEGAWDFDFAAPPEALWPYLADTARFNEASGQARYEVSDTTLPDGTVRRRGSTRALGRTMSWDEGVPNWIAGRYYTHHRRFHGGPLRAMCVAIDLELGANGGSHVHYRLALAARNAAWALLFRVGYMPRFGKTLQRLFQEAGEAALVKRPYAFELPPPVLSEATRQRIADHERHLIERGYPAVSDLAAHLLRANETDLERMRPRTLAKRWGRDPRAVLETFLAAAREGLLDLRWDLLCPRCRGAKSVASSLDRLPTGAHCPSCNIDYERDFQQNVEVTFEPAANIRALGAGAYCLASPLASSHVKVQYTLAPGESISLDLDLPDGEYRARTVEPGGAADFTLKDEKFPDVSLGDGGPVLTPGGSRGRLIARNGGGEERTLVIEDRSWAADAMTAHEVTTMQAFRDLFADAALRPGDQVEIRNVALLFTDLKGSSELYNRVGDARAYNLVRGHFAVLTRAIRERDGAVVKTIGDAVMAAFSRSVDALSAALAISEDIAEFNRGLATELGGTGDLVIVRLGLHCGPCIAVTLNDRLDYFGRTVNLAARLEAQSHGGDIVLSEAMAEDPEVAALLSTLAPVAEMASVKGFSEPVAMLRLPAEPPLGVH